jgi:hypothetical protein
LKIIFAANRTLPLVAIVYHSLLKLSELPADAWVLLRKPAKGNPAAFETFVAEWCGPLGISVEWRTPDTGSNRSGTYERDVSMVRAADKLIAYFDPATPLGENTGTGHLVERAIEEETLCEAYIWEPQINRLSLLGSVEKDQV